MVANVAAFGFAGLLSNIGTEVKKKSFSFFFFSLKKKPGKIIKYGLHGFSIRAG